MHVNHLTIHLAFSLICPSSCFKGVCQDHLHEVRRLSCQDEVVRCTYHHFDAHYWFSGSWLARRIQSLKRYLLRKLLHLAPKNCDKIKLVDRVLDAVVYALLFVKILDYLSVETGIALGSIFAIGSTGTLIISLGSQDIARGVMNGVEMAASDRFYEGDNVHFGDGTQGYVIKMGECIQLISL